MSKVVTFGEIMLRLAPHNNYRFFQTDSMQTTFGGSEANVAVSLCKFGHEACFVSKVPNHEIGECALESLKKYGVNTEYTARGGSRLGVYYFENGTSLRPSKVVYDREHSSISEAKIGDFDFDKIFENAKIFHWSGITPALSENTAEIIKLACIAAKKHGVTVSCDLNYRNKLWTPEKAFKVMEPLMQYVDICFGIDLFFEFRPERVEKAGADGKDNYREILKRLYDKYNFKLVLTSTRQSYSASHNSFGGIVYDGKECYTSRQYDIDSILDRVGGGDAFASGFLHGYLSYKDLAKSIEFAAAAGAFKHTVHGDVNIATESEIIALTEGDTSGRVQR